CAPYRGEAAHCCEPSVDTSAPGAAEPYNFPNAVAFPWTASRAVWPSVDVRNSLEIAVAAHTVQPLPPCNRRPRLSSQPVTLRPLSHIKPFEQISFQTLGLQCIQIAGPCLHECAPFVHPLAPDRSVIAFSLVEDPGITSGLVD